MGKCHLQPINDLRVAILHIEYWFAMRPESHGPGVMEPRKLAAGWPEDELPAMPKGQLPTPEERRAALARLDAFASDAIAELSDLRAQLAAGAHDQHLVDLTPDGTLLRRYEIELDRLVQNALRQFEKIRNLNPRRDLG